MYNHPISSTTSFSDDDNDDEIQHPIFFSNPATLSPPPWSSKSHATPDSNAKLSPTSLLPPEVLIHILKHLHSTRDILSALRVSRTWCECSVELLWHKPAFSNHETLQKMTRVINSPNQTFTYARFIRRLNLLNLGDRIIDDTFAAFGHCDRLERLTLVNCERLSQDVLIRTLPFFPNLVAIDLSAVVNTTDDAIIGLALSAKRLQGINLAGCSKVTDRGVMVLAQNCPLLRRVKLSGLESLTDEPVSALAKLCPLLLEIDLNHCSLITDISIRNVWVFSTHMREMRLSHCPQLTDAAFPASSRPSDPISHAESRNPFPVSVVDLTELPPLILRRTLEHLRMLDLTACSLITDDAIEGIVSHAPKIRNLVLSKCGLLTDRAVETICKLGRHLHYLHLGHAAKITDRSVRTLARSCTRLRYVDFANCTLLTDLSVFELSALPKLRRVGLVRVNNLTDQAIYSLAERHASLERIHLSYCDQISVMAVHFLLQKLHKLTHLSLTGVPTFRQPELQRFCREPPKSFNSTQQLAFCVYSGKGISQLRAFLTELFDHMTEMNGTDDTEYEEDDDAGEAYVEEDTPDPYPEEDDDAESYVPRSASGRDSTEHATIRNSYPGPPQATIWRDMLPPSHPAPLTSSRVASSSIHASTSYPAPAGAHVHRSMADALPIVERSGSPSLSGTTLSPNVTSHPEMASWPGTYGQEALSTSHPSQNNAIFSPMTLNMADSGRGRFAQLLSDQNNHFTTDNYRRTPSDRPQVTRLPQAFATSPSRPFNVILDTPSATSSTQAHSVSVDWPYRESPELAPPTQPTVRHPHESSEPLWADRHRSVKRSLRNTLNVAEHYATSLLFGRGPNGQDDGHGPNQTSGGASTNANVVL